MKIRLFFVAISLFTGSTIYAQVINGVVVDADYKKPLQGVLVRIENSGIWTLTNPAGEFQIKYVQGGTLEFKRSGLLEEKRTYLTQPNSNVKIELQRASVRIKEISLTAKKKKYSEIEIKEEALKSIQAFSLSEVLEQIPGQKIQNLNLNEFKPIVFRSTTPTGVSNDGFGNKSFGTAVVVDGIPMSNNENMQSYAGNFAALGAAFGEGSLFSPGTIGFGKSEMGDFNGYFSNTNYGADLRDIPVDNIESVEVVQGIPSAKYGDLTSGLVNVQQKSGETPYRAYVALREGTREVNFNKGFRLSERLGYLNANVNYLNSNSDPRTQFNVFERFASSLMWTFYNKSKTLSNSISVEFSNSFDNLNSEEEDLEETMINNKTRNIKISNRFNWRLKNSFIDNLNINANYTNGYQNTKDSRLVNSGGSIVGTSITEGVYDGVYSPVNYRQAKEIEGKPISMFFSADVKKRIKTQSNWIHNVLAGTSVRSSDNKGIGRVGTPETLQNQFTGTGVGFRPYNFGQNVKAEYQFSLYVEDNINKAFGNNILNVNAGLRYDNQFGSDVFQPRINAYLIHKDFKFRAGFGISSKAPSINMIYTGPRYYDVVLADLRLPGYYNLGVMQTFIDQANNLDLKPSKSARSEVGIDYKFPFGNIGLTGYYNKLYDGFTTQDYAVKRGLAELNVQYNGNNTPNYEVSGYKDYYYTQYKNINALESTDKGLELMASFWKLPIKNLSLDINGSYIETTNNSTKDKLLRSNNANSDEIYGVYRWFDTHYKQLNLGGVLNYHLPKAGLVISLRTQHFIIDDKQFDNPRIPYAYLDRNLNKVALTQEQMNDPTLMANIKYPNADEVNEKLQKVYHNFNLRVSKDFLNGFKFTFYVNNFLDLKQTYINLENGKFVTRIKPDLLTLSFGTKIEYQF